ncbi:ATP-dependent RNA helicase DDX51-like isoform X1 [Mytilus edulis]|uniref:ATP-dependent RNA helicase DDX51-like isoform X1 n=2 Tax=Mytilus edulis TaxID=6550 RepID=UPI0039F04A03
MSLFHINRYIGGDEDDDVINEESRGTSAKQILEKIKKDAEKRKIQKSTPNKKHSDATNKKAAKKKTKEEHVSDKSETEDSTQLDCLQQRLLEDENKSPKSGKGQKRKIVRVEHESSSPKKPMGVSTKKSSKNKNHNETGEEILTKKIKSKTKEKTFDLEEEDLKNLSISDMSEDENELKTPNKKIKIQSNITSDEEGSHHDESVEVDESVTEGIEEDSFTEKTVYGGFPNEVGGFTVIGEVKGKGHKQVKRVLPEWLADPSIITSDLKTKTLPVSSMSTLDQDLRDSLQKNGITQFFPVQIQVIPMMLESVKMGFLYGNGGFRPSDICVSAPTGSGKTLAFVLPIIQALKTRVTCQVRALVVLPVRDLAVQVYKVFKAYSENTHLKVVLLVGQKQFHQEQQSLVKKRSWGSESLADIIIATPGRLVDHINSTEGFNLKQLRFLVIDEADKMMDHIKQDWLSQVENAVHSDERPLTGVLTVARSKHMEIPLQKLLFSATLSQNPDKLQQLNLFQPKLFTSVSKGSNVLKPVDMVMSPEKTTEKEQEDTLNEIDNNKEDGKSGEFIGKYTTPAGLTEYYVECAAAQKPLAVLHFLHNVNFRNILCFTNSVEATHRLYHLIKLVGGIEVREFSSGLHTAKRNRILQQFSKGKIDIVICSDAMARGMDVENVKYVISYDPPPFIKTYIHRVGRTARAGKVGTAITMLQKKEFFHFKKMTREAGKTSVKELKVTKADLQPMVPAFQEALEKLQEVLQVEKMKRKSKG